MFCKVQYIVVLLSCICFDASVAARGKWHQHYNYQFPYEKDGRHFFYAQSTEEDGHNYFVQELNAGGKMGEQTDAGFWKYHYPSTFPYSMDGKQFMFGQSEEQKNYFTQLLNGDGTIGDETANGHFNQFYKVMFPFAIGGRQFFYGQSTDGNNYFIQELFSDGSLGKETASGRWSKFYDVQFPFTMNGKQYFYGQSKSDKYYFIQELNDDGTLGSETNQGFLDYYSDVQFPFVIEGKQYIYIEDDKSWYTAEISSDVQLQSRGRQGDLAHHMDFAYTIDGILYFYGQDESNEWSINRIEFCVAGKQLNRRHYSDYRLATMNLQGANDDGENKWVSLLSRQMDNYDIVALQESGAYPLASSEENPNEAHVVRWGNNDRVVSQRIWHLGTNSRPDDVYIYHVRNGRTNFRTSMAIISRRPADEVIVFGPIARASRPILGIRRGNDFFFSIHAGAHGNNEVPGAVGAIEAFMSGVVRRTPVATWIIMGDYNRDGPGIGRRLLPAPPNIRRGFAIPNRNTHHSPTGTSRILDIAITGSGVDNHEPMIAQASDPTISDHSLVPVLGAFLFTTQQRRQCG